MTPWEEVEMTLPQYEEFMGVNYARFTELSKITNVYRLQREMETFWASLYIKGLHAGKGSNMLNNIKSD